MNLAVRIVLMMTALILLTALLIKPFESSDGYFLGYHAIWSLDPDDYMLVSASGLLATEVLAIIAIGAALAIAFWNWPRRRGSADPDSA